MIASVRGRVTALSLSGAVVEVGGVGVFVSCTPSTLAALRLGGEASLPTSLVVREESLTLFGFADDDERDVFELLQTASGVGPKLAQAMLAVHGPDDLRRAVTTSNLVALTKVPGIGNKGAQRIVLELKDRLGPPVGRTSVGGRARSRAATAWSEQVLDALVGLGWSAREAQGAVDAVAADLAPGQDTDVAAFLRAALRTLSKA
ncbi:MAG: Holliday junction branch migration protein RuvA [Nocardioidaceae bacterium]